MAASAMKHDPSGLHDPAREDAVEVAEDIARAGEGTDAPSRPVRASRALSGRQRMVVAVTFFSMFFGAGNLIFPPLVGALSGARAVAGLAGFIVSAVGLPILGVLVVARAGGFEHLANRVSGRFSLVLGVAIMLTIGPLFAIPRTASTSFEMAVAPFASPQARTWAQLAYSLVFFAVAFVVAQHPDRLTAVLGRVMGPLLLVMILVLFVACLLLPHPPFGAPSGGYRRDQLLQGFLEGYQTMDLLCALYFGIVISANITSMGVRSPSRNRVETGLSGALTGVMLIVVYSALGYVGAVSGSITPVDAARDTGATVLTNLTSRAFGPAGTVFIGVVFVIACFNVCTGLISTCSSYFHDHFPRVLGRRVGYRTWSVLFTLVSMLIANIGLSAIITLAVPVLEFLYPVAIVLVALALAHHVFSGRFPLVYPWAVAFTAVASAMDSVVRLAAVFGVRIMWLERCCDMLPLHRYALGWLVPALVGVAVGVVACAMRRGARRDRTNR